MDIQEYLLVFHQFPLFQDTAPETLEYVSTHANLASCKKGTVLNTDTSFLFFLLKGKVSVLGKAKSNPVILNTLTAGMVFGMASLFGERCSSTTLVAKEDCIYALLTQRDVEEMMQKDIIFTRNYIAILSDKIRFLNQKISFFTSGSAEKKVAEYLLSRPMEEGLVKMDMSLSRLASALNMGRASLYRALDALEEHGFLTHTGNQIRITSPEEFKKIYGGSL